MTYTYTIPIHQTPRLCYGRGNDFDSQDSGLLGRRRSYECRGIYRAIRGRRVFLRVDADTSDPPHCCPGTGVGGTRKYKSYSRTGVGLFPCLSSTTVAASRILFAFLSVLFLNVFHRVVFSLCRFFIVSSRALTTKILLHNGTSETDCVYDYNTIRYSCRFLPLRYYCYRCCYYCYCLFF